MTEAEIFEFDLNGYIVYKDMLTRDQVDHMNGILDGHLADDAHGFPFLTLDPVFLELMAHPPTLRIIRTMIGEWLRLDHAYGLQMDRQSVERGHVRPNLHGGLRHDHGEHQYQWFDGQMYNGLIVVMYALEDVNPGDGGLICVPGSHKSSFRYRPPVDSHLVVNPFLHGGRHAHLHRSAGPRYDHLDLREPAPGLALQVFARIFQLGYRRKAGRRARSGRQRPAARPAAAAERGQADATGYTR